MLIFVAYAPCGTIESVMVAKNDTILDKGIDNIYASCYNPIKA